MDPKTVIVVLALNLITVGVLLALIAGGMAQLKGLRGFATGSLVFGLSYLVRLATGHQQTSLLSVLPDTMMTYATLCFITGLLQFVGRAPLGRSRILLATAAYAMACIAGVTLWNDTGRHVLLNGMLVANYGVLAGLAWAGTRTTHGTVRLSLRVLAVVIGLLSLFTAWRVYAVLALGPAALFHGPAASVYYGYSTFTSVVLGPNLLWMVFVRLNLQLERLATHDPLTGLLNRHGLDEALSRHFGARPALPLVLCQFDIDHFKRINDLHGHSVGDAVLRSVAAQLQAATRGADFVARLGGEEFLIGCVGDTDAALALAERVRQAVAARDLVELPDGALRCTLSAGVSPVLRDRRHWLAALRLADAALYRAKAEGRNAVRPAEAPPHWQDEHAGEAGAPVLPLPYRAAA